MGPLIALSDICVAPGEVGLTAMHSLIYGTPVVTHNDYTRQMPEFEAIEEHKSGAFFDYGNLSSLVCKLEQCWEDIEAKRITAETCRSIIHTYYTADYQREVFGRAMHQML